jgi:hypothetical protein
MFKGKDLNEAMGVPFLYGLCEAVFVGTYCIISWKAGWSKAPSDASLWTIISTTYEVLEAEMKEVLEIEVSMSSSSSDGSTEKPCEKEDGNVLTTYWTMSDNWAVSEKNPKEPSGQLPVPTATPTTPASNINVYHHPAPKKGSHKSINGNNPGLFYDEC